MTNVSLSGAFVHTSLRAPSLSHVQLIVAPDRAHSSALIEAQIVRQTEAGLGLEWHEFGGEKIRALITSRQDGHLAPHSPVIPRHRPLKDGARSR